MTPLPNPFMFEPEPFVLDEEKFEEALAEPLEDEDYQRLAEVLKQF